MTQLPKESEQSKEHEDLRCSALTSPTSNESHQEKSEEEKEPMVTPKGTCYLSNEEKYSPDEPNLSLPRRVQSTQSLLGLAGLEGHEESDDDDSMGGISAVTEEQEVIDIEVSPSTPASTSESHEIEDATCNTTPPGSVQGPGILSLSPPRLTTYSVGSVTSASVTESFVLQPRPVQSMHRQNHIPHESPRFTRSPMVQQPQVQNNSQRRSRPPRAPHHHSTTPGISNNVGGGPILMPRAVMGTSSDSSSITGTGVIVSGHTRTPTDATNYSFLSSLTDVSGGEYSAPRRRTLSWDHNGDSKRGSHTLESKSVGGPVTSGSILQPILQPADAEPPRPPTSISASNLRKALPIGPGPTATTPTRPTSTSRKTLLPSPSSLPSRENLHPLIKKLHQNVSQHAKNPSFISPPSHSKDDENPHPLIRKLQEMSPSKSGHTALTSASTPFTTHVQDEKKDDDSIQQKKSHDRKSSDYGSYSSSFCSSSTIRLQKQTFLSPDSSRGAFERQSSPQRISENSVMGESKYTSSGRFQLVDIIDATKECNVETNIIEGIELSSHIDNRNDNGNSKEEIFVVSDWPYLILAWGIISLGSRGFVLNEDDKARFVFFSHNFIRVCLVLGAAAATKRKLSKQFMDRQITGLYWDELFRMRQIWAALNEIAILSTSETKDNSDAARTKALGFRSGGHCVCEIMDFKSSSSVRKLGTARDDFIESSQIVYERLARRNGETEVSFQSICKVVKHADGSADPSKVKLLADLFCQSRQGSISKLDFVKSTDRIFKETTLLVANVRNTFEICQGVEKFVNAIFFTIAAILSPSAIGADTRTLLLTVLCASVTFVLTIYATSIESLKAILRLLSQKSYDIGDRVCFIPEGAETNSEDGPPSGGWIVEKMDLYKTTLRQGITGERSTFSNDAALFRNTRVVNWKRSHKATLRLSMEFSDKIGSNKIDFIRRQISQFIEDRPYEWARLESFRMVGDDAHSVKYDIVLRHRESWYNYAAVRDSKSDMLFFLRQLRMNVEQ